MQLNSYAPEPISIQSPSPEVYNIVDFEEGGVQEGSKVIKKETTLS